MRHLRFVCINPSRETESQVRHYKILTGIKDGTQAGRRRDGRLTVPVTQRNQEDERRLLVSPKGDGLFLLSM